MEGAGGWKGSKEEVESGNGNAVIEKVIKRVKDLAEDREGIAGMVRAEFMAEVKGNAFLCEVMTEL